MVVDKVDRTPTANAPEIAKQIPPLPDLEFEVASFKLAAPDDSSSGRLNRGGRRLLSAAGPCRTLLVHAWDLPTGQDDKGCLSHFPSRNIPFW